MHTIKKHRARRAAAFAAALLALTTIFVLPSSAFVLPDYATSYVGGFGNFNEMGNYTYFVDESMTAFIDRVRAEKQVFYLDVDPLNAIASSNDVAYFSVEFLTTDNDQHMYFSVRPATGNYAGRTACATGSAFGNKVYLYDETGWISQFSVVVEYELLGNEDLRITLTVAQPDGSTFFSQVITVTKAMYTSVSAARVRIKYNYCQASIKGFFGTEREVLYTLGGGNDFSSAYETGYLHGSSDGYQQGMTDAEKLQPEILEAERQHGYNVGYKEAKEEYEGSGYEEGFFAGKSVGFAEGEITGKAAIENDVGLLTGMVSGIVNAPFELFGNILNFNILGINVWGLCCGLITIGLVLFLLKKLGVI